MFPGKHFKLGKAGRNYSEKADDFVDVNGQPGNDFTERGNEISRVERNIGRLLICRSVYNKGKEGISDGIDQAEVGIYGELSGGGVGEFEVGAEIGKFSGSSAG